MTNVNSIIWSVTMKDECIQKWIPESEMRILNVHEICLGVFSSTLDFIFHAKLIERSVGIEQQLNEQVRTFLAFNSPLSPTSQHQLELFELALRFSGHAPSISLILYQHRTH